LSQNPVVVASAMGKTTNALLQAGELAASGKHKEALDVLGKLRKSHVAEAEALGLTATGSPEVFGTIDCCFKEMANIVQGLWTLGELTPRSMDAMASFGERLSTLILAHAMKHRGIPAQLVDARQFMITDDNFTRAAPIFDLTDAAIREHLLPIVKAGQVPVVQGFIGATRKGITARRLSGRHSTHTTSRSGPTSTAS
jgi:aspartate kinase